MSTDMGFQIIVLHTVNDIVVETMGLDVIQHMEET